MKLGAVASFIMGRDGVEVLESEHVPAGVMNPVEPVMISKKLWDGDRIVMVSDGVLDAMPGAEKGSGVFGFPCRSAGGRAPGDSGDDHGLCPVL